MKTLCTLALVVAIAGCAVNAPQQTTRIMVRYDAEMAAAMMQPGRNTITGSALLRQRGGGVVTCAGSPVVLIPVTAYANERFGAIFGARDLARTYTQSMRFDPDPPEFNTHRRLSTCNAQGFFRFENVADGDFLLVTKVVWTVGRYDEQGGFVRGRASVRGGQTVEVVIAP